jgi:APA family basic amino acid/polyamine antiporter
VGSYLWPAAARPVAVAAVLVLAAVTYCGITRTVRLTRLLLAGSLTALAVLVAALLTRASPGTLAAGAGAGGAGAVLQAGGLLFFAFAGYARIATLGEEVVDPGRTIPRAIPIALGITLVVYAVVAASALAAAGPAALASSPAPLRTAVEAGSLSGIAPAVRIGAAVACLGVLLSLLAGVGRTAFAMAWNGDLPRALAAVEPRHRVPRRAELAIAAVVVAVVAAADVRSAIGFSSFAVLVYYAIANASAVTLRGRAAGVAALGLAGCLTLAFTLPWRSVAEGGAVLAAGALVFLARNRYRGAGPPRLRPRRRR